MNERACAFCGTWFYCDPCASALWCPLCHATGRWKFSSMEEMYRFYDSLNVQQREAVEAIE